MKESAFHYLIDQHRNPNIWERNDKWEWVEKCSLVPFADSNSVNGARLKLSGENPDFELTRSKNPNCLEDKYILIGKGYVDLQE